MPSLAEMADAYLAGASQLREAVKGMTPQQATARPVAGKWSTLECVAHVADFEPVFADRMKRVIALDRPLLFAADENEFFKHLAYDDRDLDEELAVSRPPARGWPASCATSRSRHFSGWASTTRRASSPWRTCWATVTNHLTHHLRFIVEKRQGESGWDNRAGRDG